jgi:hypothetical protein
MPPVFTREATVNIWRNHTNRIGLPTSHFGHAAIALHRQGVGDEYVSWWPGEGAGMKDAFRMQQGTTTGSYQGDALSEMNPLTAIRLEVGYLQGLGQPVPAYFTNALAAHNRGAIAMARATQQRLGDPVDNGDGTLTPLWAQNCDAHMNLPGLGAHGRTWGLSINNMERWWADWNVPARRYQLASKTHSCAGAAAQGLAAGGAEAYVKRPSVWIYMAPNDILDWANSIRHEVDSLDAGALAMNADVLQALIANPAARNVLWDVAEWKRRSAVSWSIRRGPVSTIDAELAKYHELSWAADEFTERLACAVKIFRAIIKYRRDNPDGRRNQAMCVLAGQILRVVRDSGAVR